MDRWRKRDVKSNQINQQKHTPSKVRTKTGVAIYQNRTTNNTAKPMSFVHKKMSIQPAKKGEKKRRKKKTINWKPLKTQTISPCARFVKIDPNQSSLLTKSCSCQTNENDKKNSISNQSNENHSSKSYFSKCISSEWFQTKVLCSQKAGSIKPTVMGIKHHHF